MMTGIIRRSKPMEPKGQNFTFHEKMLLLDLICEHGRGLVEENDTLSLFRRSRIWRHIHGEFNRQQGPSSQYGLRSEKQLRLLWKNMKARCKREFRANASKYRGYIQDPLLRKMSTLIGVEDDEPAKMTSGVYRGGVLDRKTMRQLIPRDPMASGRMRPARAAQKPQRSQVDQRVVANSRPSQIQIANSYSMAPPAPPPVVVVQPPPAPNRVLPAADIPTQDRLNISPGNSLSMAPVVMATFGQDQVQEHYRIVPILEQVETEMTPPSHRTNKGPSPESDRDRGKVADEAAPSRRKKAVPRKASPVVKEEQADEVDVIIELDDDENTDADFITQNGVTTNEASGGWEEDIKATQQTPSKPSFSLDATSTTATTSTPITKSPRESPRGAGHVPLNNLHHQLSARRFKPANRNVARAPAVLRHLGMERARKSTAASSNRDRNRERRVHAVNGEDVIGVSSEDRCREEEEVDEVMNVDVEQEANPACTVVELAADVEETSSSGAANNEMQAEMLRMARKEHEAKMATMMLKRKQAMQIKRREHLAKLENFRLKKDILRLKKKKLEMEIRSGMYLEEVEDELDDVS